MTLGGVLPCHYSLLSVSCDASIHIYLSFSTTYLHTSHWYDGDADAASGTSHGMGTNDEISIIKGYPQKTMFRQVLKVI